MPIQKNVSLAPYTTFEVGGPAEELVILDSAQKIMEVATQDRPSQLWLLGFGANTVVSDKGLPGLTVILRSRSSGIYTEANLVIADAAAWWDDVVSFSISRELWGLELMSYIPGGVGAAVIGNIAAYGQAIKDSLAWVEVLTPDGTVKQLLPDVLDLTYRSSAFQNGPLTGHIILRAAFKLSESATSDITYQAALSTAEELKLDTKSLSNRRRIIQHTRLKAGSIWLPNKPDQPHTAGSFFRNPMVTAEQAEQIMAFDETGRTKEQLQAMNQIHGGDSLRVSAAHVLLAAGFKRGQEWGPVRLHPSHVLKLENTGGATAQNIYDVSQEIIMTVRQKLDIIITPEVNFLGVFDEPTT